MSRMEYKGFDIRVEVARNFFGPGFQATYQCCRELDMIYSGTIVGNLPTVEDAEGAAYKAAAGRIDESLPQDLNRYAP